MPDSDEIEKPENVKYLGVYFDNKLNSKGRLIS